MAEEQPPDQPPIVDLPTDQQAADQKIVERIAWVRDDRAHGASALAREAADILRTRALIGLKSASDPRAALHRLHQTAQTLAASRPSMVAIANTVGRIWAAAYETPALQAAESPAAFRAALQAAQQAADELLDNWSTASQQIAHYARPFLLGTILTHSLSGTTQAAILACRQQIERVYVTESRPRCEGRATAQALAAAGISVTLLTDAEAALFIPTCAAVVVGADSVLADGSVVNKAGTYLLALAARANRPHAVPFVTLAEQLKIAPARQPHLEEMDPAEVLPPDELPGVTARNIYFDRTPSSLVSALITEHGSLSRAEIRAQAAQARRWARLLERRAFS
jgi:translation initiation factor 2B subunit (eIF-2B alpha/beta/delta family)